MKEIQLTQGKVALVDDEDYEYLNRFKWHARKAKKTWYADLSRLNDDGNKISMHRFIMQPDDNVLIDHKDRNGLNNQRNNLRECSQSQNLSNVGKPLRVSSHSKYKGVTFSKDKNTWMAQIKHNYKYKYIGYFKTEIEAALAYNQMAFFYHGEFANLNQLPIT